MLYIRKFYVTIFRKGMGWEAEAKIVYNTGETENIYFDTGFGSAKAARAAILHAIEEAEGSLKLSKK